MACLPVQVAIVTEPLISEDDIAIIGVGTGNSGMSAVPSITYAVTVEAGLLVVTVGQFNSISTAPPTVTYDGNAMTLDLSAEAASGPNRPRNSIFSKVVTAGSGNIVVTGGALVVFLQSQAINITGLTDNAVHVSNSSAGSTSSPMLTGSITTTVDDTAVIAVFAIDENTPETIAWGGGFVSGGQDVQYTIADTLHITEGRKILSSQGSHEGSISTVSGSHYSYVGVVVAYS